MGRDDCDDEETEELFDGKVEHLTWRCRNRDGALQHYKINAGSVSQFPISLHTGPPLLPPCVYVGAHHADPPRCLEHSWPSTEPNLSQDKWNDKPAPFNASEVISEFFRRFKRPDE